MIILGDRLECASNKNCTDVNAFSHVLKIRNCNGINALCHIDVDSFQRSKCTVHSSCMIQVHSFAKGDSNAITVLPFNGDTCMCFKIVDCTFSLANNNLGTFTYMLLKNKIVPCYLHRMSKDPIHKRLLHCNSNPMVMLSCHHPSYSEVMAMTYYTWHDSIMYWASIHSEAAVLSVQGFPLYVRPSQVYHGDPYTRKTTSS